MKFEQQSPELISVFLDTLSKDIFNRISALSRYCQFFGAIGDVVIVWYYKDSQTVEMWECNLIGIWVKINKYAYKTPTYTEWLPCNTKGKTFYECKDIERQWRCLIGRQKPAMFLHALRKAACGIRVLSITSSRVNICHRNSEF